MCCYYLIFLENSSKIYTKNTVTFQSLSRMSTLKKTKIKFEFLVDIDMLYTYEKRIEEKQQGKLKIVLKQIISI